MPRRYTSILVEADSVVQVTAQRPANMSENCSYKERHASGNIEAHCMVCDKWFVGLVLLTLVRSGEALAGEQVTRPGGALKPDFEAPGQRTPFSASMVLIPKTYQAPDLPESKTFSTQDFRPRGRSILEKELRIDAFDDAPAMGGTTMWQRLSEYRSSGRVRLLTLWETGGSSVSLLAGKRGEPSLQWTSRLMNRGGATHGLLDRFFSTSLAGSRGLHFSPHASNAEPTGKPAKPIEVGGGPTK
jgi:hypothetical protein